MIILVILAAIAASSILYINKSKHTSDIIDDIAAGVFFFICDVIDIGAY